MMLDFFMDVLYQGTIGACKKYRCFKWIYLGLIALFILTNVFYSMRFSQNILAIIFIMIPSVGLFEWIKGIPHRFEIKRWEQLFEGMKLNENDPSPRFMYAKSISPYAKVVAFKTIIPLSIWERNKEVIEMHINKSIINITQDDDNNQIIKLLIQDEKFAKEIEWQNDYTDYSNDILNIGVGSVGVVGMDLQKYPHAFIAGETGSGKSNILKCMIHQAINKGYDTVLIDFKRGVSFSSFIDYIDVHFDYLPALEALKAMVNETTRRLDLFREKRVDNLNDYNKVTDNNLKRQIIFIDELAEFLKPSDKALSKVIYESLETLTRISRAAGIHLIMGIQRPDSTIISGQIKNNVSFRVCGRFPDREPSIIMLGNVAANKLSDTKGRFIVKDNEMQEIQCFYYSDNAKFGLDGRIKKNVQAHEDIAEVIEDENEPPKSKKPERLTNDLNFDFSDII